MSEAEIQHPHPNMGGQECKGSGVQGTGHCRLLARLLGDAPRRHRRGQEERKMKQWKGWPVVRGEMDERNQTTKGSSE